MNVNKNYCVQFDRFGSRDCGFAIESSQLDSFPEAGLLIVPCGDANMQEYFVIESHQLQKPEDWESASDLYLKLKVIAQL